MNFGSRHYLVSTDFNSMMLIHDLTIVSTGSVNLQLWKAVDLVCLREEVYVKSLTPTKELYCPERETWPEDLSVFDGQNYAEFKRRQVLQLYNSEYFLIAYYQTVFKVDLYVQTENLTDYERIHWTLVGSGETFELMADNSTISSSAYSEMSFEYYDPETNQFSQRDSYKMTSIFGKRIMQDYCAIRVKRHLDRDVFLMGFATDETDGIYVDSEYVLFDYQKQEWTRIVANVENQIEYSAEAIYYNDQYILCMRIMTYKNRELYKYNKWSCFNFNETRTFTLSIEPFFPDGNYNMGEECRFSYARSLLFCVDYNYIYAFDAAQNFLLVDFVNSKIVLCTFLKSKKKISQ